MKYLLWVLGCFLLCAPLVCSAADSQSQLVKNLKGKIVFLRGMESGDKLSFDAQGNFTGTGVALPFAYSAVLIKRVNESGTQLEISGQRLVLVFIATPPISAKDFHYIPLDQSVTITFTCDSSDPDKNYAAIHKAFAFSVQDDLLGRPIPDVQKAFATLGLNSPAGKVFDLGVPSELRGTTAIQISRAKLPNGALPPRLIYSAKPAVRRDPHGKVRYQGICVIGLTVSRYGIPEKVHIVRSVNSDLDQKAVEAVEQYRFLPALKDGRPVPVSINIEVDFQIYSPMR